MVDFQRSLEQSSLLTRVRVKGTDDLGCMIEATCQPAVNTPTISEIIAEVERLWMEELRYQHFEAHALVRTDYNESLEFVTESGQGGFYVTGRIAVDISGIQGPVKAVTFSYRLIWSGWSDTGIYDGVNRAFLCASYLSDALRDLTNAVVTLVEGAQGSTCRFAGEPSEHRWVFARQGDCLRIEVLWFDGTFPPAPDEKGKLTFSTACNLRQFAGQLRDELRRLLAEHGVEGYRRKWVRHEFPMAEYQKLEELLAPEKPASG